jgi:uncharacterized protein YkwD
MSLSFAEVLRCCDRLFLSRLSPFRHSATPVKSSRPPTTNAERTKEELPPLKFNPLLGKVARAHSENMARQMKMEHKLDDKTPFDRLDAAGYDFMRAAENIAFGDEDAKLDVIMKMWMESKGHRANIMNKDLTEIGIGIARGKDGFLYYTQVFGRPFKK